MMINLLPLTFPSLCDRPLPPHRGEEKPFLSLAPWGRGRGPSDAWEGEGEQFSQNSVFFRLQRRMDGFQNTFQIYEYICIPKSQYEETSGFQRFGSFLVSLEPLRVLPTVQFEMSSASRLAKSATYPSKGTCRRNLRPAIWRLRSLDQRMASASVWNLRKARACAWVVSMRQSQWQSLFESRLKDLTPHLPVALRRAPSSPHRGEENL